LAGPFESLARLGRPVGQGAVLCLCGEPVPLAENVDAVPVGMI